MFLFSLTVADYFMKNTSSLASNSEFYIEGFKLALHNSFSLKKIANLSFAAGEYGIACSLNILAAEEAVKAIFILIKHYNPETEINDFKEVFSKHPVKHYHLKGIALVYELQLKRFKRHLEIIEKFIALVDQLPKSIN